MWKMWKCVQTEINTDAKDQTESEIALWARVAKVVSIIFETCFSDCLTFSRFFTNCSHNSVVLVEAQRISQKLN